VTLYAQVQNVDAKKYANVARWHKHITSFSTAERSQYALLIIFATRDRWWLILIFRFGPSDSSLHHHSHDHHEHKEAHKEEAHAAPAATAKAAPATEAAAGEDEIDLFGEEDPAVAAERERVIEERRKAHEAKKAASGKVVVAKSSVIFDVKPWDDQTGTFYLFTRLLSLSCSLLVSLDLAKMEEAVRTIQMEGLHWGAGKNEDA
jgi:hypothetical protein